MKQSDELLWLNAALDGELDVMQSAELEARLAGEPALKAKWDQQMALRKAIREGATYHEAPLSLHNHIAEMTVGRPSSTAPTGVGARLSTSPVLVNNGRRSWLLAAASAMIGAFVGAGLTWRMTQIGSHQRDEIAEDAVAGHVRARLTGRMVDVVSSDQHTVRPWLSARLAYASPVPDLSAQGFELLGARLDVIDAQTAAVLVYQRRNHIISVFVRPLPSATGAAGASRIAVHGFNVVAGSRGGMLLNFVSDLNARELNDFAELFEAGA